MSALALDYTLSHTQFNFAQVAFAEHYERPKQQLFWPVIKTACELLSGAHIFNEHPIGFATSSSSVIDHIDSTRETLDSAFEVEKVDLIHRLQKNLFDSSVSNDVDAVTETIDHTYELISRWGPSAIDLNSMIGAENAIHLAAVLRVTSDSSEYVPGWKAALSYAIQLMEKKGIDADDALFGLVS